LAFFGQGITRGFCVLSGLILTAFLMGLGGMPHCAAMCGAPCAAAFPKGLPVASLVGRCIGYAGLGGLAAASAGALASWGREVAFLQPLWVILLAAVLMLGLYLLASGRMPSQVDDWGQGLYRCVRARWSRPSSGRVTGARGWLPLLAGVIWVAMPCGLLYAALMVAALAPSAWGGALVMLAFALPGAVAIWAAPVVLRGLQGLSRRGFWSADAASARPPSAVAAGHVVPVIWMNRAEETGPASVAGQQSAWRSAPATHMSSRHFDPRWAVRLSGAMLAAMTGWALYHQLLAQWQAWCA
jgi:sulfite exporter TauE/SafE